jgi:hypothetical protein
MQAVSQFTDDNEKEKPLLCPAKQIGSRARALLVPPGSSGKVLAVVSTTIYLVSRDGEILVLSREGLPMHRRSILVSIWPDAICVGQNFFVQGPFLRITEGVTVDLGQATEWKPIAVGPKHAKPLTVVHACTRQLVQGIAKLGDAKGLGQMIPLISSLPDGNKRALPKLDPLLARAYNSVLGLATACFNFDMMEITQRGRELVGLGPGLTPSGDDFLGGLLFAAHSLKTAYPEEFDWKDEQIVSLIDWACTQTHPISHALLSDHAFGHGPEPLHEVVASLLNGQDVNRTTAGAGRLLGIGDASGWDILAGMLTGMLLVGGKVRESPPPSLLFEMGKREGAMEENFDTCRRH